MEGAKLKALKQIFPELRNFEGKCFEYFLEELSQKVEDWAIQSRLELGRRKCFNIYREAICRDCKNMKGSYCTMYSDPDKQEPTCMQHPNTGEWYWCIKKCPDYSQKE